MSFSERFWRSYDSLTRAFGRLEAAWKMLAALIAAGGFLATWVLDYSWGWTALVWTGLALLAAFAYFGLKLTGQSSIIYFNPTIEATRTVRRVCPVINEIKYKNPNGTFEKIPHQANTLSLLWAPEGQIDCRDLLGGVPRSMGLLQTCSKWKRPRLAYKRKADNTGWDVYDNLLSQPGTYQITVAFTSDDLERPEYAEFEYVWDGHWDHLNAQHTSIIKQPEKSLRIHDITKESFVRDVAD